MDATIFTINGAGEGFEGIYFDFHSAKCAWVEAGSPRQKGSSVWVSESNVATGTTVNTTTIG